MLNQSIATMTLQDLESLINRIVQQQVNQTNLAKDQKIEQSEIVSKIHILQENLKQKYGVFSDSIELLREDKLR